MNDPLPAFHFQVDWGATRMGFKEVDGLGLEATVIEYREGNSKVSSSTKIPGRKTHGDVTLKRGMVLGDNEIFEWFNSIKMGAVERRDITISLLNESHEPVAAWKLANAWIKKLVGPTLDAQGNSVAIEEMVLTCDGITIENG